MKKFFLGLVGLVVFFIIVGVIIGAATDTSNKAVGGKIHGNINIETYDKIKVGDITGKGGMTLDQVNKLIGKKPIDKSETQSGETNIVIATYSPKGMIKTQYIVVSFTNGKASSKSQMGLDN